MHHLVVKNNTINGEKTTTSKLGFRGNNDTHPLCPKPRRVGSPLPEFLSPLRCNNHRGVNCDGKSAILNMISEKMTTDARDHICSVCSSSCYPGSPPSRTDNPLIHDMQFVQQMEGFQPISCRSNLSNKFGFTASPM